MINHREDNKNGRVEVYWHDPTASEWVCLKWVLSPNFSQDLGIIMIMGIPKFTYDSYIYTYINIFNIYIYTYTYLYDLCVRSLYLLLLPKKLFRFPPKRRSLRRSEAPIVPFEPGLPTAADAQQQPIWGAGAHHSSSHRGVAWDGLMFDVFFLDSRPF